MNKELILKYKAEFDHWLNGGGIAYRYVGTLQERTKSWYTPNQEYAPVWNPDYEYVINDEYVEFRKALAEGKTLQSQTSITNGENWSDFDGFNRTDLVAVRIKPDEPKSYPAYFREKSSNIVVKFTESIVNSDCFGEVVEGNLTPQKTLGFKWRCWNIAYCPEEWEYLPDYEEQPKFEIGDWVRDVSSQVVIKAYEDMIEKNFEQWTPHPDEWCWFWDYDHQLPTLNKYHTSEISELYRSASGQYYLECEPFIGPLPSILKEPK